MGDSAKPPRNEDTGGTPDGQAFLRLLGYGPVRSLPTHTNRIRHVAALDGLRGLALLGVLFFHANGALPGGYLGVDLFFVLSGFLITSLLLAEHSNTGHIDLTAFWIRRAKRLFPALLSLMPAVAIYGRYFAKPDELSSLRGDALATLAYVANWRAIFENKSYWELFSAPSPLEHTWSLSIEEQFYVFWPLLVAFILRRRSKGTVLAVSLGLVAISMAAMALLFTPENSSRAYLGTDTRMAGILGGAALATLVSQDTRFAPRAVRALDLLGIAAAAGLAIAWWKMDGAMPFLYRGGFWLTEVGALILITCALVGERSLVARALSIRPLTLLGTVSYGVYLWHWPVNVFLTPERAHLHGLALHVLRFALTFAIAIVSYRYFEHPIRTRGLPFGRPQYTVPAAVALCLLLVVRATYARPPTSADIAAQKKLLDTASVIEPIRFRVSVFGDSTANSLGWCLRSLQGKGVQVDLFGKDGCSMVIDRCDTDSWAEHVRELRPNASLMFAGGAFMHGISVKGQWQTACGQQWGERFERVLTQRLGDLRTGTGRVYAVTLPYALEKWDTPDYRQQVDCINASIRKSAAAVPGVTILDLGAKMCTNGVCQQYVGPGEALRPDGVHFSILPAQPVARWVFEQLQH